MLGLCCFSDRHADLFLCVQAVSDSFERDAESELMGVKAAWVVRQKRWLRRARNGEHEHRRVGQKGMGQ